MVDVKEAIRIAIRYLHEFAEFSPLPPHEIRLEETEYDDSGFWLITLSFAEGPFGKRHYKIFKIDQQTGEVKWMRVRTLQPIE